jgi:hypothetical protein
MNNAYIMVKNDLVHRRDAFSAGFKAIGYKVALHDPRGDSNAGDVLAIWNRKGHFERIADRFEAAGGTVLVAENGYIGRDDQGQQYYAIARHAHNGRGEWPTGGGERWARLGVQLKPWRADGEHILICPNRHFGQAGGVMPANWEHEIARQIQRHTSRPVRIRPHPGHWKRLATHPDVTLADDLRGAWAVVIWGSSAGVKALVAGIPVIRCAPWWIAASAAGNDISHIANPPMPERLPVFERLAWAQWTMAEIADGTAFRALLPGQLAEAA